MAIFQRHGYILNGDNLRIVRTFHPDAYIEDVNNLPFTILCYSSYPAKSVLLLSKPSTFIFHS